MLSFSKSLSTSVPLAGRVISREIRVFLDEVSRSVIKRHSGAWPGGTSAPGTTPGRLSKRSGAMVKSIADSIKVSGRFETGITAHIGGNAVAQLHETGAVIRPKKGKYLAIPLPEALDSRGVELRKGPRAWDNTFIATSKRGNLIIFQRRGRRAIPLYVLKAQVRIPPRLGMQDDLIRLMPSFEIRMMEAYVRELDRLLTV